MEEKIRDCLAQIGVIIDTNRNFDLIEVIEDSLMFVSLIVELESAFDIEIPDEFLLPERLNTFDDLKTMITELQGKSND